MKKTFRKTMIFTLTLLAVMAAASVSFAQRSTSTSVNIRNNMSVGGETGRGMPAIDQKIDLTDPVLDSKASGTIQTEEQRDQYHDKTKAHIDGKGKLAPVEGDENTVKPVPPAADQTKK